MLPTKQELSNLLGIAYDAADNPALWAPFTEKLAQHTKSTSAALLVQVFNQGLYSLSNSWRVPEEFVRAYQDYYHGLDVWAEVVFLKKPSGYVCTSQSLCPLPQLKKSEFYNDGLVRGDIEHGMFGLVENSKSCLASVCLYRNKSRTEFTDSDQHILEFLAPHLQRAFKMHLHFSELRAHSSGVEAALDMLPAGVILLGPRGEIVRMNRSASALIAEKDGLLATRYSLQAEQQSESSTLTKTIQQAALTSNGKGFSAGGTVLVSRRTRPPLQVQVSPIHRSAAVPGPKAAVAVFIKDPQKQHPDLESLRALYQLTPAECRIALLLSEGHAPRQIADKVGVTNNTIRSQIKSIFSKTGVRRQGELIRLLLSLSGNQLSI
jgi:DNA-binding CsgD family transcriptional regulator